MDASRYEHLKSLVAEYGMSGKLDAQYPINAATYELLAKADKDALFLLNLYCTSVGVSGYPFYGFELTGRTDNKKFLCVTEHGDGVLFGVPSRSKKEARSFCALRVLDCLILEQKLQTVLDSCGKKVKAKPEPPATSKAPSAKSSHNNNALDFTKDVDNKSIHYELIPHGVDYDTLFQDPYWDSVEHNYQYGVNIPWMMPQEFYKLNPPPPDCTDVAAYTEILERAIEFFNNGMLYELQISASTKVLLESNPNTHVLVNSNCPETGRPVYYTFIVPGNDPNHKFVTFAVFEGGVFYGILSRNKAVARTTCAAVIVDKLFTEGRLQRGQTITKKVSSKKRANTEPQTGPEEKIAKLNDEECNGSNDFQLTLLPGENLNTKTLFYIISLQKNALQIFNEFCQKNKLKVLPAEYSNTSPYVATLQFGEFRVCGIPNANKKLAKQTAARAALDVLVSSGRIPVVDYTNPLLHQHFPKSGSVFETCRRVATEAIQEAAAHAPLIGYCGPNVSAFFLLDASSNTVALISWAVGNCFTPFISANGSVVNDCSAITLARRGLLRFLFYQLVMADGDTKSKSVFCYDEEKSKYRLRSNLSIHFYSSEAPDGDALAGLLPSVPRSVVPVTQHPSFNPIHPEKGALSVKVSSTGTTALCKQDSNVNSVYLSMSSSDKLLKWNTVGVQGALLNLIVEPIYIDSIAVAKNYDTGNLSRALVSRNCRANISEPFCRNQPYLSPLQEVEESDSKRGGNFITANWNAADNSVEIVSGENGQCALGGLSRLCRRVMFRKFVNSVQNASIPLNYTEAKAGNTAYAAAVQSLKSALENLGVGKWIQKPQPHIEL